MAFFDLFKTDSDVQKNKYNSLYLKLVTEFPDLSENELVLSSCIAGLMARVAYVDFKLDDNEIAQMKKNLSKFSLGEKLDAEKLANMATKHITEMAGLDNHLYVHPLKTLLTVDERYKVLQSLFLIAASDGSVENFESEEIRLINKGLELSNQHFISARAEVVEFINALR